MYQSFGELDTFYSLAPDLSDNQKQVLVAYYEARRETEHDKKIKRVELEKVADFLPYPMDFSVKMMQALDDHYMALTIERTKRECSNDR